MGSKIQAELSKATDLELKRGGDRQDFLFDMVKAVAALPDAGWDALSKDAQAWYNVAADAKNAKKDVLPDFPDLEPDAPATTSRRRSSDDGDAPAKIEVGTKIKGVTSRGKEVVGTVIEIDGDLLVIDDGGKDPLEFNPKTAKSLDIVKDEPAAGRRRRAADDDGDEPKVPELKVGDQATAVNKRGKSVTGKIVEMNADMVVIDDGKDEHEFQRDRIESLTPAGGAKAEEPASGRRRASAEDKKDETPPARTRSTNEKSVGERIKELIAEDLDIAEADIGKQLKKEGMEFKDNTLSLNYRDAKKFVEILRAAKRLK